MVPYQAEFQKLSVGVKGVGAAFRATSSMAQLLKVALASTGIGLLVVALGSLVAWLTKTQKGMDFVGKVTAAVSSAFKVVIERLATFAEGMGQLVTGNFAGAWDSLKSAVSGFGTELSKETKAAWENTGAMQALNREQALLAVNKAKARAEIEKLKKAAEDQTASETARLAAASKAYEMEQSFLNQAIALQERRIKLIADENSKKGITLTDEDKQAQYDAEIELANLQEESFTRQTELQNKVNELKKAGAQVTKETAKEEFLVVSENIEKEIEALGDQIAREAEALKKSEEDKIKLKEEALAGRIEQLDRQFEMEQMKLDEQFFNGSITEEERRQLAFEQEKTFLQNRLAELALFGVTEQEQYQAIYTELARIHREHNEEKRRSDEAYAQAKIDLEKQSFAAASQIFGGMIGFLERDEKARRKNFAVVKALKLAELTVSSVNEIQDIWRYANANPLNAVFPGAAQAIAVGKTIAAGLRYATGVANINKSTFADGGMVPGPSHRNGGIKFLAGGQLNEMEGGEIILTKGVYQDPVLRSFASMINQMGGGRSFAMGGPVTSGLSAASSTSPTTPSGAAANALLNTQAMEVKLDALIYYTRQTAEKPVLALTQIKDGLESLYDVENDATF
jgi:hypothetical protein